MFKNHALSVQMVKKTPNNFPDNSGRDSMSPDEIATILMYHANHAAKLIAGMYVGKVVLITTREIVLMKAASKIG